MAPLRVVRCGSSAFVVRNGSDVLESPSLWLSSLAKRLRNTDLMILSPIRKAALDWSTAACMWLVRVPRQPWKDGFFAPYRISIPGLSGWFKGQSEECLVIALSRELALQLLGI